MTHTKVLSVSIENYSNNSSTSSSTTSSLSLYSSPWPIYQIRVLNTVTNIEQTLTCEALLNATGRTPNIHNLGLDKVSLFSFILLF